MKTRQVAHPRAALTTDCVRHQAEYTVPCWCGATDAKPGGLNVIGHDHMTKDCTFWFISWIQATQKKVEVAA